VTEYLEVFGRDDFEKLDDKNPVSVFYLVRFSPKENWFYHIVEGPYCPIVLEKGKQVSVIHFRWYTHHCDRNPLVLWVGTVYT